MNEVYGEPVQVQARDDGRPVRFVWRGRLYTVRVILEHWVVNREWWRDSHADPVTRDERGHRVQRGLPGQRGLRDPPELEFWRVEAAPGLSLPTGVYELRREPAIDNWVLC